MIASKVDTVNSGIDEETAPFIFVAQCANLAMFVSDYRSGYGSCTASRGTNTEVSTMKTLIQCDFDGTVTEQDISFVLLDAFARGDWHQVLRDYKQHMISVGEFNTRAFAMVKADEQTLLKFLEGNIKVRSGFHKLVNYCREKGSRLVIVSNGLHFYIKAVLEDLGLKELEVHAAEARFHPKGMEVHYLGPGGTRLDDGFKEAYIESFLKLEYRVVYIGNGDSDIAPARYAHRVFATGDLIALAKENNLKCRPFETFVEVIRELDPM